MMEPEFEIPCRSFRIGSLKANPSKSMNRIKLSKKGFRFRVSLGPENDNMRLVIPIESITLVEGNLGRGCPVLWISTDTKCAAKIRKQCGMIKDVYPTPYFDPNSEELSEKRICVIPLNDPICQQQHSVFRGVLSAIAAMRKKSVSDIFCETAKKTCHEQLVHCTKYISEISGLQTVWKLKREKLSAEQADMVIFPENQNDAAIVLSSDDDSDSTSTNQSPKEKKSSNNKSNTISHFSNDKNYENTGNKKSLVMKATSHKSISAYESLKRPPSCEAESVPLQKASKVSKDKLASTSSKSSSTSLGSKTTTEKTKFSDGDNNPKVYESSGSTVKSTLSNDVDKSDAAYVRAGTSLNADMQTLYDDLGSMSDVSPLCICVMKSQYAINFTQHKVTCMAVDNVDGKLSGCLNIVSESFMMRASKNLPTIALCSKHKLKMVAHECCPCCGTFCTGGTFLICSSTKEHQHRFHQHCLTLTQHSRDCPHCGASMSQIHMITLKPDKHYLMKYKLEDTGIIEKSPDKRKQSEYPDCVVKIPGVTLPLPRNFSYNIDIPYGLKRNFIDLMLSCFEEDIPKKGRLQSKNLYTCVKQGDLVKALQLLCFGSINPDSRAQGSKDDRTCLHEAVFRENLPMIHLLVTAGANVNLPDGDGKTPIFYAEEQKNLEILKYLLCCGSSLVKGDNDGMLPLHYSAKEGRLKTCLQLLKYGKEAINSTDEGGWTSLVWSAEHKRTDIARCLTYFDASIWPVDNEGNICLQWAALAGDADILLLCLRRNSDVDHQNSLGDTALHIAARQDNRRCVVLLLAWGANPLIRNGEGKTPSDCAKEASLAHVSILANMMTRCAISDHRGFEPFDRERLLCRDISRGKEKIAISCVNAVDEVRCPTIPPHEFLYISKNIHKHTSINAVKTFMKSCQCRKGCMSCDCGPCWYDLSGRLLPSFDFSNPPSITECNPFCKCPKSCINRVIQTGGVRFRIQLFRTKNIGWGVRAIETIPTGSYICEYVGEVMSINEAREDDSYLFDLRDSPGGIHYIDGRSYGNVSRYLNHHCEPNLVPVRFFYGHQDISFPRVAFFSKKAIMPGEQLCFDYGPGFWSVKSPGLFCECGSEICRYSEKAFNTRGNENSERTMNQMIEN